MSPIIVFLYIFGGLSCMLFLARLTWLLANRVAECLGLFAGSVIWLLFLSALITGLMFVEGFK